MSKFVPNRLVRRSEGSEQKSLNIRYGIVLFLIILCLVVFFTSSLSGSSEPRWALLLLPTINPDFINDIWFGIELPKASFSGERFVAFGLGILYVVSSLCLGLAFVPLIKAAFKSNCLETLLFATAIGLVIRSCVCLWLGLVGLTRIPTFQCSIIIILAFCLFFFFFRKRKRQTEKSCNLFRLAITLLNGVKRYFLTAVQTSFDKFFLYSQLVLILLFSSFYPFSATQPIFEYDAVEYHVQSAREIFETGKIGFFPNNVYANMPLGAEMFYVAGFNIAQNVGFDHDDVLRIGSLIGKTILTGFAYLTALALFTFGFRFLKNLSASIWASIVFLSFPGVFEVYSNGLNDGVLGFVFFASLYLLFARAQMISRLQNDVSATFEIVSYAILLGIFSGFAMGIKYTGVVFVVFPICFLAVLIEYFPRIIKFLFPEARTQDTQGERSVAIVEVESLSEITEGQSRGFEKTRNACRIRCFLLVSGVFILTILLVSGGWYLRNVIATGNPVYPLAYSIFGDNTGAWNESVDLRWKNAHSSSSFGPKVVAEAAATSLWKDRVASPFFVFFGVFGLWAFCVDFKKIVSKNGARTEKLLTSVCALFLLYWILWFFMTHRLTRFLLPAIPLVAIVVGSFVAKGLSFSSRIVKLSVFATILICLLYSGLTIDLYGQGRMAPLRALERDPLRFTKESVYFNERPELFEPESESLISNSSQKKLLLIGEAKAFMYRVPVLYSTCWNDSPLIPLLDNVVKRNDEGEIVDITNASMALDNLRQAGIEFILVDFAELARFRSPGNYGFNNSEINENLFRLLVNSKIIVPYRVPQLEHDDLNLVQIFRVCLPPN